MFSQNRSPRAIVAGVAVLTMFAAACGGDDDASPADTAVDAPSTTATGEPGEPDATTAPGTDGPAATTPGTTAGSAPAEPATDQTRGGSLVYGTYSEGSSFDPADRGASYCNPAIYDSLMKFDENGIAQPYMAESFISEDNVVWTLKLRDGILFHDGTPLDAEAVKFNVERHMNPDEISNLAVYTVDLESVAVIDPLTVEFTLKAPRSVFPDYFAIATGLGTIVSPTALQTLGEDFNTAPVGAGPFKFQQWIPDDHLTLVRNENYWQEGLPYLDELICRPLPDTQVRLQSVLAGDTDLTYMITATEIAAAEQNGNVVVDKSFGFGAEGIVLNDTRPPFDDLRMRQAFVHLLNPQAIAAVRFGGDESLTGAISLIPEDSPYYNPEVEAVWPQFDVDAAKALVEEYVADGGDPSFTFRLPNTPDRRAFGDMAAQLFAEGGMQVTLDYIDISEFITQVIQAHDFQAAINSNPAAPTIFPQWANVYRTGGVQNSGEYSSPEMDALIETAISTSDPDEATEAWKAAHLLAATDISYATYGRPPAAIISQPNVAGIDKYADGSMFFATLSNEG